MGNPSFAFRFARPCRKDQHSPTCCCIFRFKYPLTSHQQRKRAASAAAASANPTAESTPAPASDPAATPAATPAPEAPKPEEAAKPAEDAKPAEAPAKAPFTPAEDVALLSLKAQNKSWKNINEVLVGRDLDEMKSRFKEIGPAQGGQGGEASKEGAVAGPSNEGRGNKGKQQQQQKGKGKQEDAKTEEKKDEPAVVADGAAPAAASGSAPAPAPTKTNEAVVADRKDAQIKGILRRGSDGAFQFGEAVVPDGATTLNGCPIIYLEEDDLLNIEEVSHVLLS